jgi:predicted AlkP superfamily phosphohydrolase/phosphomutase
MLALTGVVEFLKTLLAYLTLTAFAEFKQFAEAFDTIKVLLKKSTNGAPLKTVRPKTAA